MTASTQNKGFNPEGRKRVDRRRRYLVAMTRGVGLPGGRERSWTLVLDALGMRVACTNDRTGAERVWRVRRARGPVAVRDFFFFFTWGNAFMHTLAFRGRGRGLCGTPGKLPDYPLKPHDGCLYFTLDLIKISNKRINPYLPIFNKTPAKTIDP